jgi:hypothetical protein
MFLAKDQSTEQKAQPIAQVLAAQIYSSESAEHSGKMSMATWRISPPNRMHGRSDMVPPSSIRRLYAFLAIASRIRAKFSFMPRCWLIRQPEEAQNDSIVIGWGTTVRILKRFGDINRQ